MGVFVCGNRTTQQNWQKNLARLVKGGKVLVWLIHFPSHSLSQKQWEKKKKRKKWEWNGLARVPLCSPSSSAQVQEITTSP